jgi:two-component system LytT family sensor kinase
MELNKLSRSKFYFLVPHILFWVLYAGYEVLLNFSISGRTGSLFDYIVYYLLNIFLFYVQGYNVIKNTSSGKSNYILIVVYTVLEILLYLGIKYLLIQILIRTDVYKVANMEHVAIFIRNSVWRAVLFIILGTGYGYGKTTIASAKRINELDKQRFLAQINRQLLEKNLLSSENAFLKAQINQHFLFNMLSFIHSNVLKYSDKIGDLIISLSDLMRYAFTEPDADGKVKLSGEVEHIENYLSLNQHRFNHQLNFDFRVTGDVRNIKIISLLLITIIENVFKYGDLQKSDYPAKIYINVDGNKLHLHVDNYKLTRPHAHSSGIGMGNVQKRLELVYPDNYWLNITQDTATYQLDLNINIPTDDMLHH